MVDIDGFEGEGLEGQASSLMNVSILSPLQKSDQGMNGGREVGKYMKNPHGHPTPYFLLLPPLPEL